MTDAIEVTIKQASERLHRTPKTVLNMIKDGRLSARLVDAPVAYYLITLESIERIETQVKAKRDRS
jgi:hypothetical protein